MDNADRMPDSKEIHLPFLKTEDVYELFQARIMLVHSDKAVATFPYFLHVLSNNCLHIKVHKAMRFSK